MRVEIAFEAAKDAANLRQHAVSLGDAAYMEWDTLWVRLDRRRDYGEPRFIGVGYIGLRLFCVVFTDRGEQRRIISLRKANAREVARYAET